MTDTSVETIEYTSQEIPDIDIETSESDFMELVDNALNDSSMHVLGRQVGLAMRDPGYIDIMRDIAESASEDSEGLWEQLYSVVEWEVSQVTVGEAISGSQHQAQFGILSSALNALILDKEIGFFEIGSFMLQPIQMLESTTHGKNVVITGHHRLFTAVLMLRAGDCSWESILSQTIPVFLAKINTAKLKEVWQVENKQLAASVAELEAQLWLSGNASRKSTSTEKSAYKDAKKGVSLFDKDSILTSDVLSHKDKAVYYSLHLAYGFGIFADPQTGAIERELQLDPSSADFRVWTSPKINTFSSIMSSALTNLAKIKVFANAEDKRGTSKWQPSLDSRHMPSLIEQLFDIDERTGSSLIDDAIVMGCASAELGWQHNVAKSKSLIGKALAEIIDGSIEPIVQAVIKTSQKSAQKGVKTVTKFKGRRVV